MKFPTIKMLLRFIAFFILKWLIVTLVFYLCELMYGSVGYIMHWNNAKIPEIPGDLESLCIQGFSTVMLLSVTEGLKALIDKLPGLRLD